MGFKGSHGFMQTRSWNVGKIIKPDLAFCYRYQAFVSQPPVGQKYLSLRLSYRFLKLIKYYGIKSQIQSLLNTAYSLICNIVT